MIAEVRTVATTTDPEAVVDRLSAAVGGLENAAPSVVLVRRAVALCGWLRNDNERSRAAQVAGRVLQRLENADEATEADRAERLYWEAMLLADILGDRAAAFERLQVAGELAPDDERISASKLQLAQALAEFGR